MRGTWLEPYQPDSLLWATSLVSGICDASIGPSARSVASTSARNRVLAASHCVACARNTRPRMRATIAGSRLAAWKRPSNSNSRRSCSTTLDS